MSKLKKLAIPGAKWVDAAQVLHVSNPHALTQAAGYLKFVFGSSGPVFYRGQTAAYPSMYASLHRGISTDGAFKNREKRFAQLFAYASASDAFLSGAPAYAYEAILQHYGIRRDRA